MNRRDLLTCLRNEGYDVSDRTMRDVIHSMITNEGYCIQSSSRGYELIKDRQQLEGAVRYIESYIIEMAERKRMLIENFERQTCKLEQLNIFS